MLLLRSPTGRLGYCEGCWALIVPPEDENEACLCVECSSECNVPVWETTVLHSRRPGTWRRPELDYEDSIPADTGGSPTELAGFLGNPDDLLFEKIDKAVRDRWMLLPA